MNKLIISLMAVLFSLFFIACGGGGKEIGRVHLIPVQNGKEFQYIDKEGKITINPQFGIATVFRDGLALVRSTGEEPTWGFIDEEGTYVITSDFKSATVFSDGLAWAVQENGAPSAINTKGEIKFTLQDAQEVHIFREGVAAFSVVDSSGVKWGFVDKEGKVKINPQFTAVGDFSNGRCAVRNFDEEWGYIDKEGKLVINFQFSAAKEFINGRAVVFDGEKAGLINEEGKFQINPQFSSMKNDGDRYLVKQNGKFGWCDDRGKFLINPQFSDAFPFKDKPLAAVKSGRNWGYIDYEGRITINPQFDYALPLNNGIAIVQNGSKWGSIDDEGRYIVNPQFEDVASDYAFYIVNGNSEYETVETDYFNIGSIVSRTNLSTPEGLPLECQLAQVVKKFRLKESAFNKYSNEHQIFLNQKITNDASLSFYIIAEAYTKVPSGWSYKYEFNPDAPVLGFAYTIRLFSKGTGREWEVFQALEESLSSYTLDENESTEEVRVYRDKNSIVKMTIDGSEILIGVMAIQEEM